VGGDIGAVAPEIPFNPLVGRGYVGSCAEHGGKGNNGQFDLHETLLDIGFLSMLKVLDTPLLCHWRGWKSVRVCFFLDLEPQVDIKRHVDGAAQEVSGEEPINQQDLIEIPAGTLIWTEPKSITAKLQRMPTSKGGGA
jgi:hypothetical protein